MNGHPTDRGSTGQDERLADVVIAGGGPTGLMLAIELCLGGVRPVVLERLPEISEIPKGNGLVGQIVPTLDYRGLLDELRNGSTYCGPVPAFSFGALQLDFSRLGVSPLHVLAIPQRELERKLAQRLAELGGSVSRGHELTALSQDSDAVTLEVSGPPGDYRLRADYLVGCDGAHSVVRKQAGIGFPGITSAEIVRIGRVIIPPAMIDASTGGINLPGVGLLQPMQMTRTAHGFYSIGPLKALDPKAPPGAYIISTRDDSADKGADGPMTLDELRASVRRVVGAELPMSDPIWLTRVVGNSRQAERYQDGRVLLAGDAAHLFGIGGSLNAGMLDAINLGWKLAAQVAGRAPDGLLASYHAERHAAGLRVLMHTRVQRALSAGGEQAQALRDLLGELLQYSEPLRHIGEMMETSELRYDMPGSKYAVHPLVGRFAPDLDLATPDKRTTRVAELMRAAHPVLLDFSTDGGVAAQAEGWSDHVSIVVTEPLIKPAPADALLIRPDGYIAWASVAQPADPAAGLQDALTAWCGPRG
jgi:2-polyprenyl-6-methoxyphenol hydroxylase-like FAD-dependent oxidoreductase